MNWQFNQQEIENKTVLSLVFFFVLMMLSVDVYAQAAPGGTGGFKGACDNVVLFFQNFETLLKAVSVLVVTVAIVFAGYQIAFAHKRLSDVAPVLIGGLLIGGAAAIAGWFTAGWTGGATTC
ncbi:TrbC/VirB2 family protein [Hydrogenophaga aromaticivorans]|uniref:TrbC/VirB2 family protein n=1 Tax=Hydrogenophaga aromaticivorans TaxID=2610898 RepID=UPI001C430670